LEMTTEEGMTPMEWVPAFSLEMTGPILIQAKTLCILPETFSENARVPPMGRKLKKEEP